jgi:DNA-directed RNA polymerase specialized sigma24 family protein
MSTVTDETSLPGSGADDPAEGGEHGADVVQDAPVAPRPLREDFGAHFEANYPRLVAQLYAITLDSAEAHDAVQDAYARAWKSWSTIGHTPDPSAWVRRVAVRSTIRSWRRWFRRGARPVPAGAEGVTGTLLEALRRLDAPERRCVVLHHMAGASATEIAAIEGVSPGTVGARLRRAQAAVADVLQDAAPAAETAPPGAEQGDQL